MTWWWIYTISHLTVGLVTFKVSYRHFRGNHLADLHLAQVALTQAKERLNEAGNPSYYEPGYAMFDAANRNHRMALEQVQEKSRRVRDDGLLVVSCVWAAILWPLSLAAVIAYGLWKVFIRTFFRKGLETGAKARARKLVRAKEAALEQQRINEELIQLGREVLEEEKSND
jgi:hypothetical protein